MKFQTNFYEAKKSNDQFGWNYDKTIFQSKVYNNASEAVAEFNTFSVPSIPWIATMRVIENNEIIEEETFDSSVMTTV